MRGSKRIPDHLKAVTGTARAGRMNPDAPIAPLGVVVAPGWLSDRASELFSQLSAVLEELGLASPVDQYALSLLASRIEEVEHLTSVVEDAGRTYQTDAGMWRARPEVAMRNEAMRHAQSLLGEFGLSPGTRAKVAVNSRPEDNPFAAFDRM
jgi:P27 family predicted phage terminase small subunit